MKHTHDWLPSGNGWHLRVESNGTTSSFDCGPVTKCGNCEQLYCYDCQKELPYK